MDVQDRVEDQYLHSDLCPWGVRIRHRPSSGPADEQEERGERYDARTQDTPLQPSGPHAHLQSNASGAALTHTLASVNP
jgi:hypothetical protein